MIAWYLNSEWVVWCQTWSVWSELWVMSCVQMHFLKGFFFLIGIHICRVTDNKCTIIYNHVFKYRKYSTPITSHPIYKFKKGRTVEKVVLTLVRLYKMYQNAHKVSICEIRIIRHISHTVTNKRVCYPILIGNSRKVFLPILWQSSDEFMIKAKRNFANPFNIESVY